MIKKFLCWALIAFASVVVTTVPAEAQIKIVTSCGGLTLTPGQSSGIQYMDATGNVCTSATGGGGGGSVTQGTVPWVNTAPVFTGNGSIALTTSSVLLNTLTRNTASAAFPATLTYLELINVGSADAAVCPNTGGTATCTCPENVVAATNGITLAAGKGGYTFPFSGLAAANPSIVSCSATTTVQVRW